MAPNRLAQRFEASRPDQIWLADMTYIRTDEGWLYLATVMDLYSRRILGWSMASRMTDALCRQALTMAIESRNARPQQLIHHSEAV